MKKCKSVFLLPEIMRDRIYGDALVKEAERQTDLIPGCVDPSEMEDRKVELRGVEVVFSGWGAPVLDEKNLSLLPDLKPFLYGAGSIRGIATETFWEREIPICSAAPLNAIPVAEYTLAQIIFSLKNGWRHLVVLREEKTRKRLPMAGAYGSRVGIVSLGEIGRRVCRLLQPFDMEVVAYDPFAPDSLFEELGAARAESLDELFRTSDVVSLHAPNLPETKGLITGAHFRAMKPDAVFLNTARGNIIREQEMVEALLERTDVSAVLDVLSNGDQGEDPRIWELPNIFLTPHIAGSVENECRRMGQAMLDEAVRFQRGEPLQLQVTPEVFERMA